MSPGRSSRSTACRSGPRCSRSSTRSTTSSSSSAHAVFGCDGWVDLVAPRRHRRLRRWRCGALAIVAMTRRLIDLGGRAGSRAPPVATLMVHAAGPGHRAGACSSGARAAVRQARRAARAPSDGEGLAPRHRAAGQAVRARAPPEGDQRGGRPARAPRRGLARRARSRATPSRSAPRRRARRARRRAARAYEAEQRARAPPRPTAQTTTRSARACPTTRSCTATRAASPTPSGASATVTGIYFTGDGDDVQQWARVRFQLGVRTVPAGSLQFVDFSKPDPGAERVQRFITAAQHAMAEGDYALAAQRLVYARDAEPRNAAVLRLMTLAFWQAGDLRAAGRAVRDWARVEGDRPAPHRFAARIYEDMGASTSPRRPPSAPPSAPAGRRRLGAGRPAAPAADGPRGRARGARARAALGPSVDGLLDLALVCTFRGTSAARSPPASRRRALDPGSHRRRGRATRTRLPAPTAHRTRSRRASTRSRSTPRTPTSRTC